MNRVSFIQKTKRYTTKYWFIFWNYVFLLLVLNKNENIINAAYWVLSENRKTSFPIANKKNQSVLIAKISSRKTNQSAKISCHTVGANAFP